MSDVLGDVLGEVLGDDRRASYFERCSEERYMMYCTYLYGRNSAFVLLYTYVLVQSVPCRPAVLVAYYVRTVVQYSEYLLRKAL
jgi:hypothetical protein